MAALTNWYFFVEEVIRMLIDRGAITQENGRRTVQKEIEGVEIPDNLQGLLLARIDRLPDEVKHTLRVASVIGRQFSVRVLDEVLGA
jgi:predicted ATPase